MGYRPSKAEVTFMQSSIGTLFTLIRPGGWRCRVKKLMSSHILVTSEGSWTMLKRKADANTI